MAKLRGEVKTMRASEKFIIFTAVVAVLSLFLPWISLGQEKFTGLDKDAYFLLIFLVYPVYKVIRREEFRGGLGTGLGLLTGVLAYFYTQYRMGGIVGNIRMADIGLLVFILACLGFAVANYLYSKGARDSYRAGA